MRKGLRYILILAPIVVIVSLSLLLSTPAPHQAIAQYYIVGGELEAPQIKTPDYAPLIVAGAAAAALLIGIIVASKIRESKAE